MTEKQSKAPCKRRHEYYNEGMGVRCGRCGEFLDGYEVADSKGEIIKKRKLEWVERDGGFFGSVLDNGENKVFLSYQPNNNTFFQGRPDLDSANPETAIVLIDDKELMGHKVNRFLIFRGDRRTELEPLYPDIEKLKAYWKEHGGHFWSDSLDE